MPQGHADLAHGEFPAVVQHQGLLFDIWINCVVGGSHPMDMFFTVRTDHFFISCAPTAPSVSIAGPRAVGGLFRVLKQLLGEVSDDHDDDHALWDAELLGYRLDVLPREMAEAAFEVADELPRAVPDGSPNVFLGKAELHSFVSEIFVYGLMFHDFVPFMAAYWIKQILMSSNLL